MSQISFDPGKSSFLLELNQHQEINYYDIKNANLQRGKQLIRRNNCLGNLLFTDSFKKGTIPISLHLFYWDNVSKNAFLFWDSKFKKLHLVVPSTVQYGISHLALKMLS